MSTPKAETTPVATTPAPADYATIRKACVGIDPADARFIMDQLDAKATEEQARNAWTAELQRRLAARDVDLEQVQAATQRPGVTPLPDGHGARPVGATADGDAVEVFDALVRERVATGMERQAAVLAVARHDKGAHRAYLEAVNAKNPDALAGIARRFAQT